MMKPYYQDDAVTIYHGDCREVLPAIEPRWDCVLTSPPYNIQKPYPCDDWPSWNDYFSFLRDVYGRCVVVGGIVQAWLFPFSINDDDTGLIRATWAECGLPWKRLRLVLRHPSVDDSKSLIAMPPRVEILCLDSWAEENGAKIWYVPHAKFAPLGGRGMNGLHPAAFHERLPQNFFATFPSARCALDPFAGTGTTLSEAKKRGLRAIGIEIMEENCEIAARRCAQEVLKL